MKYCYFGDKIDSITQILGNSVVICVIYVQYNKIAVIISLKANEIKHVRNRGRIFL